MTKDEYEATVRRIAEKVRQGWSLGPAMQDECPWAFHQSLLLGILREDVAEELKKEK